MIRIDVEHDIINPVAENYDIVFAMLEAPLPSNGIIIRRMFSLERGLYASPALVERLGEPRSWDALMKFPLLTGPSDTPWAITTLEGTVEHLELQKARLVSSNAHVRMQAAIAGHGVLRVTATYARAAEPGRPATAGCCRIMFASRSTCTRCCRRASSCRPRSAAFLDALDAHAYAPPPARSSSSRALVPPGTFSAEIREPGADCSSNTRKSPYVSRSGGGVHASGTDHPNRPPRQDDAELVRRALGRDEAAVRAIMQANNRRLYRIARGDSAQRYRGRGRGAGDLCPRLHASRTVSRRFRLSTWLSRIAMNEALGRLRRQRPERRVVHLPQDALEAQIIQFPSRSSEDPEKSMAQREIQHVVEHAIDELPEPFRIVFITRVIEGMSVEETAEILGMKPETVKTRLHRARTCCAQCREEDRPGRDGGLSLRRQTLRGLTDAVLKRLGFAA